MSSRSILAALLALILAAPFLAGCDNQAELAVDLWTDYAPGWEFDEVIVAVDGVEEQTLRATARDRFGDPVRVAELAGVASGRHSIVVSLMRRGRRLAYQETVVRVSGSILVRAILTRSCEGVACPGADDAITATACLGGTCVDPACLGEADAGPASMCSADQCTRADDCAPRGCVETACDRGACLWIPVDDNCEPTEYCDGYDGACLLRPGSDAGIPDAGTPDAGPPPSAPALMLAATSSTAMGASWPAVPSAATYEIEFGTSATLEGASTEAIEGTGNAYASLSQGRRYYARVRGVDAMGRAGEWSNIASAVTPIDAPGTPSVSVTIPGATRPSAACCWVTPPGGTTWYYAQGHASSNCPVGTNIEYRFQAQYTSPATIYGWTGWGGPDAFMINPNAPYGVRFFAQARCVGVGGTSDPSGTGSGCRLRSGGGC
jgi:hypothetical protein